MEPHAVYKIRFKDGQEIIAKFIRNEQLANELTIRSKFVIGNSITIKVAEYEYTVIEKIKESIG